MDTNNDDKNGDNLLIGILERQNIPDFQEDPRCFNFSLDQHNVHQRSVHAAPSSAVFWQ
jgi:hypothetical protein